jgi:hypothetical protein
MAAFMRASHFPTDAKGLGELLLPTSGRSTISDQDVGAPNMTFKLKARINRTDARTIQQALDRLCAKGSVKKEDDEFIVEAKFEGTSAKELNRTLLSALRKVNKKTTLRAEWISGDITEKFFDYVLKKTIKG